MVYFFEENLIYLKCKISPKFHNLLFLSYFFSILTSFFSISPIKASEKIIDFFLVFYWKDWRFYRRILEISWRSFKKIYICEIFFVLTFLALVFLFFIIIFDIFFSISSICTCQKIMEIFCSFILWIRDFIKEF